MHGDEHVPSGTTFESFIYIYTHRQIYRLAVNGTVANNADTDLSAIDTYTLKHQFVLCPLEFVYFLQFERWNCTKHRTSNYWIDE